MDTIARIKHWIANDSERMKALDVAARMDLPEWCLAAGFVRNLVWDKLHGYVHATALNDIDLIYFDPADTTEIKEKESEQELGSVLDVPWSVKNQARMHLRNDDRPYSSTSDAMSYWVEVETAVGATLNSAGDIVLVSPFGFDALFDLTVTINAKRPKPVDFHKRMSSKRWLDIWPRLVINA
ncbi:MAG TPA: nitrate reductase [Pseudohongiella sp.]|nr:nitrate reductase [Pseudohongiella sp.]HBX35880.1 nitrate reductase [Pseudohongiella sp.]|tara:strand:- start:7641 stop:8186 length:546 start_codon:yes stop_codon:yes gene_type:complete